MSAVKDMLDTADEDVRSSWQCRGIGGVVCAVAAGARRHAQPARRSAAPARHRQEVRQLCRPRSRPRPDGRPALASLRDRRLSGHHHPGRRAARSDADRADAIRQRLAADQDHDPAIAVRAARRHARRRIRTTSKARSISCSACSTPSADGRYLFSGRAVDQPPVETTDHILNGDGLKAGLKQIIDERRQADLGASGLGRLVVGAPAGASTSLTEDAVSPFGFKLAGVDHDHRRRDRDRRRPARRPRCRSISARPIRTPARPSSSPSRCRTAPAAT